jgi:hypothetical protein
VVRRVAALRRLCLRAVRPRAPSRTCSSSPTSSTPASHRESSTSPTSSMRSPNRRPLATSPPTLPQLRTRSLRRAPLTHPPPPTHRQARPTCTHPRPLPRSTSTCKPSRPAPALRNSGCRSTCNPSCRRTWSTSSPPASRPCRGCSGRASLCTSCGCWISTVRRGHRCSSTLTHSSCTRRTPGACPCRTCCSSPTRECASLSPAAPSFSTMRMVGFPATVSPPVAATRAEMRARCTWAPTRCRRRRTDNAAPQWWAGRGGGAAGWQGWRSGVTLPWSCREGKKLCYSGRF